jgi:hypothetical protein
MDSMKKAGLSPAFFMLQWRHNNKSGNMLIMRLNHPERYHETHDDDGTHAGFYACWLY